MAAPILWAPGILGFFLLENPTKFLVFGGVGFGFFWKKKGGGSANFTFIGVGIFLKLVRAQLKSAKAASSTDFKARLQGWSCSHTPG